MIDVPFLIESLVFNMGTLNFGSCLSSECKSRFPGDAFFSGCENFLFSLVVLGKLIVVSLVTYCEHDLLVIVGANTSF